MPGPADDIEIKYGEILPPESNARREQRVRRGFWRTLKRAGRRIPFAEDVVAAFYPAPDRTTPGRVRATLFAALAYFVLPTDAIPDFIAGLGFTDDVTVLLATLGMVRAHIRPDHREAAKRVLADDPPPR
jgi:uncharacterized membrane protein YkvA (DUF1232 family)